MQIRTLLPIVLTACTAAPGGPTVAGTVPRAPSAPPTAARQTDPAGAAGEYAYTTARTGDVHDFDFIAGAWTLQNRRLK